MQNPKSDFTEWLARLGILVSFVVALFGFLNDVRSQDPTGYRLVAVVFFILYVLGSLWFTFKGSASQGWKWAALALLYLLTALFAAWVGTWLFGRPASPAGVDLVNRVRAFDFEAGLPADASLGVCTGGPAWYDNCIAAPGRLQTAAQEPGGRQSLAVAVELRPDGPQVYSVRLPVNPPLFVDALTADVFIAHPEHFSKVTLAARVKGQNVWVFSDPKPAESGWLRLLVDLQSAQTGAGGLAIDEIHLDLFVEQAQGSALTETVLLDNLELYYPLSASVNPLVEAAGASTPSSAPAPSAAALLP